MQYIKGFTFKFILKDLDEYDDISIKESIQLLKKETNINTIVFAIQALQNHPQSEVIDY